MKIEYLKPTKETVSAIRCTLPIDSEDREGLPAGLPGDKGDTLTLTLDLDTRKVRDWPTGLAAKLHLMPRDAGSYELLDERGSVIKRLAQEYVPACLPQEFGDYFIADVQPDGRIKGWQPYSDDVAEAFWSRKD